MTIFPEQLFVTNITQKPTKILKTVTDVDGSICSIRLGNEVNMA
jgi:hypothetical protein